MARLHAPCAGLLDACLLAHIARITPCITPCTPRCCQGRRPRSRTRCPPRRLALKLKRDMSFPCSAAGSAMWLSSAGTLMHCVAEHAHMVDAAGSRIHHVALYVPLCFNAILRSPMPAPSFPQLLRLLFSTCGMQLAHTATAQCVSQKGGVTGVSELE